MFDPGNRDTHHRQPENGRERICAPALATGSAPPELALRLTEAGLGVWRRGLAPAHARVVSNARRLKRRAAPRARLRDAR